MASLQGKVIAITGSASGIGLALAHLLVARGASISIADVQKDALAAAVTSIQKSTPEAQILSKTVNVTSSAEVSAWLDETIARFGSLDGAANLAGVVDNGMHPHTADVEEVEFDFIIGVNLKGVFNCLQAELKRIKYGGSVVNASSVAGIRGYPTHIAYCASKHAVIGMTKTAAVEYAPQNIRVNAIAPGPIDTPMMGRLTGDPSSSPAAKGIVSRVPLARYGTADEAAQLVAFLLGDESSYCTGGVMTVDGGLSV
ncbi:MAG: hypothetical protein Q9177_000842 [Variospora cf. flavescens]